MFALSGVIPGDVVIQHGTETWMLADELAEAGISVSFTLVDSPGGRMTRGPRVSSSMKAWPQ